MSQKIIVSGVQPTTNKVTLGNYIGAMKNWLKFQDGYDGLFFVADLHSLTVKQDPKTFKDQIYSTLATFLAVGIDPKKSLVFVQSQVPAHAELAWILNCFSTMGELSRMTQYKEKSQKAGSNIPAGLFNYPVLMAADVLIYDTDLVPVGVDQKQHIELTRDIAVRMNQYFSTNLFKIPDPYIPEIGAKIMSLQDPTSKMSKSDANENATIFLSDSDAVITKKIKRSVTDSGDKIIYSESSPGVMNLINIYSCLTGETTKKIVEKYEGKQYGHLKVDTAEIVVNFISPIRNEIEKIMKDKSFLDQIMLEGARKAASRAQVVLERVFETVGLPK